MSIPAKIKLSSLPTSKQIDGRISFSPEKTSLMFSYDGETFLVTLSENKFRVKKTGALSYDMIFEENAINPVTLKTSEGALNEFYMTTHSLTVERKKDFLSVTAVYSFDCNLETQSVTLECYFFES